MRYFAHIFALVILLLLLWVYLSPVGTVKNTLAIVIPSSVSSASKTTPVAVVTTPATSTTPATTPAVPVAATVAPATAEQMIAAMNISRMSRGWNGVNTGGTYDDTIGSLSDAEKMSLSTVEVGKAYL